MGIVVDLIIVAVIALFIIAGYKKGLTGCLIKLVSFVLAIVIAAVLYKPVANGIMQNTKIDDNIKESIIDTLSSQEEKKSEDNGSKESTNLPTTIANNIEEGLKTTTNNMIEQTAEGTTTTIMYAGTAILLFIIARVLLGVISLILKGITNLPVIKQVDKIGGFLYGIAEGLIIVYLILAIISLVSVVWVDNNVVTAITSSYLGNLLYKNNIIINLIYK